MNRIKTIKCLGAAAVLFAGLFAASAVYAGYGPGNHYGHHKKKKKKKKKHHRDDDDDYKGGHYRDDDDDYKGGGHYRDDDDDYKGGGHYRDDDDDYKGGGHYGHSYSDLGVQDLTFRDLGGRLVAEVTVTGIDAAQSLQLDLEATSDVRSNCGEARRVNDPLDVQSQASRSLTQSESESQAVRIETDDSVQLAADLVSCPGGRLQVQSVEFLDARIDVTQGDNVLTLLCTFAAPTTDGEVPANNVECWSF